MNNKHQGPVEAYASLRIVGTNLEPATITEALGVQPSDFFRAGDEMGKGHYRRHGLWRLTSQGNVHSANLEDHITWLLQQVEPHWADLDRLRRQGYCEADVFCFWQTLHGQGGVTLSPSAMGQLASMELVLGLDIYCWTDDGSAQASR